MIQLFMHQFYLGLAPLALLLAVVGLRLYSRSSAQLKKVLGEKNHRFLSQDVSLFKRKWKLIFQSMVIALLLLTLARPQGGESETPVIAEGVELMLVVDVSESMLAEDVRPSRLAQAKAELSKMLDMLPGHKIGIVAFAGSAVLVSPLSTDPGALKMYLDSLSPLSVSTQGTEFKSALSEAKAAFDRGGVGSDPSHRVTRVILLASDGEDHEPGALEAAKKLTEEGIRIFSLVYGTEKGGPIPVRDSTGALQGYRKDKQGQTVLTTVHGDALKALADAGQGSFNFASFGGDHLKRVVDDINKLEKSQFEAKTSKQYEERFQIFAIMAFILAIFELMLSQRKRESPLWRGRFEVP